MSFQTHKTDCSSPWDHNDLFDEIRAKFIQRSQDELSGSGHIF